MSPIRFDNVHSLKRPDIRPSIPPGILGICQEELDKLYPDRLQQVVLKKQLQRRSDYFRDHPKDFFVNNQWFELYKSFNFESKSIPAYVMRFNHVAGLGNLRIFFALYDGKIILLHAFQEKKTGYYEPAFRVAENRLSINE